MKEGKPNYFSHDTNASNDPKIISIRLAFGWKAVGMYWAIIEALHKEKNGELPTILISSMILDFYSQEESREMNHIIDEHKKLEESLYANALLIECDGITTSKRVKQNLKEINIKSEKARKSAKKRWEKSVNLNKKQGNANAMRTQCERNANKVNKSKVKKSKEEELSANADTPFSFETIISKMLSSKDIRMPIIANYWQYRKISFENKDQYQAGLKRELRAVSMLKGYDLDRIKKTMFYLNTQSDWLNKWTLETVHKSIDNIKL